MKYLFAPTLLLISLLSNAQSKEIMAKAYFLKAQDAYGEGDYQLAVNKLEQVVEMLESTNPRIEYLRTQCYYEIGHTEAAQKALNTYFELASDGDPNYSTMLRMIDKINEKGESLKREKALQEMENRAWESAKSRNTVKAYELFISNYSNSKFNNEARKKLSSFPSTPLVDSRDGQTYETVRIGNQVWMAENLRHFVSGAKSPKKKYEGLGYGMYYSEYGATTACPYGWRLPARNDVNQLFEHLGISVSGASKNTVGNYVEEIYANSFVVRALMSDGGWKGVQGTNSSGFSSVPSHTIPTVSGYVQKEAAYWMQGGRWKIYFGNSISIRTLIKGTFSFSYPCRCIKN